MTIFKKTFLRKTDLFSWIFLINDSFIKKKIGSKIDSFFVWRYIFFGDVHSITSFMHFRFIYTPMLILVFLQTNLLLISSKQLTLNNNILWSSNYNMGHLRRTIVEISSAQNCSPHTCVICDHNNGLTMIKVGNHRKFKFNKANHNKCLDWIYGYCVAGFEVSYASRIDGKERTEKRKGKGCIEKYTYLITHYTTIWPLIQHPNNCQWPISL